MAHQTVDELVKVFDHYGKDYDREKAYTEEIDVGMKNQTESKTKPAITASRKQAGDPAQGSTMGGKDSIKDE